MPVARDQLKDALACLYVGIHVSERTPRHG